MAKMPTVSSVMRVPAIEVRQGISNRLYTFAVDGKRMHEFATISRIRRTTNDGVQGYQRPEVQSHIDAIRKYVESDAPMVPNAVVLALDDRVVFEPFPGQEEGQLTRHGTLIIPCDPNLDESEKPAFIVDGQQRLAAVREADVESFPLCVTAFITNDVSRQVEQFILVNSTKPLPKGLIYELLPNTHALLPPMLQRRRYPAMILERLNFDEDSPLRGLIQTATSPKGIIKDNSVLKLLENSLTDGVLFRFRDPDSDGLDRILDLLKAYWRAVRETFPEAWGLPAKRSRLMHGAGMVSMGYLMESIIERYRGQDLPTESQFKEDLRPMKEVCRWTDGIWDFGPGNQRKWNTIQNTHSDIQTLSSYLYYQYRARVWNKEKA